MTLDTFWIVLIIFVVITIIRFVHVNTILNYLIKNHKSMYKKYNPEEFPKSTMFIIPYKLVPITIDVFTNKLMLDESLKKIVNLHRFFVILHVASIIGLIYVYFGIVY